jgi:large subunit ribosomal protein L10
MPISRQKKEEIYSKLDKGLKASASVVFVNFHGLLVSDLTVLRKIMRDAGITYVVAKKTIASKVLAEQGYKGELPELKGELAVVYGADQLAPAREISDFEKKFKGKISILGGVFEGEYKDATAMKAIANIPSREVLLSQIAYLLKSPIQRLAIAVNELSKQKA